MLPDESERRCFSLGHEECRGFGEAGLEASGLRVGGAWVEDSWTRKLLVVHSDRAWEREGGGGMVGWSPWFRTSNVVQK